MLIRNLPKEKFLSSGGVRVALAPTTMREKLNENATYSKPYARISITRRNDGVERHNIRLWLSVGASIKYNLKDKERVDLIWERKNKVWDCPILIIKRGGTQRSLSTMGREKSAFSVQIKMLVKQYDIPLLPYPLPILDYVDGEIWIDFSGKRETEVAQHKLWEKRYGKAKRHSFNFEDCQIDVRSNSEFIDQCKVMAENDGGSLSGLVLRLLAIHMEDNHQQLWYQLINSLGEN